MKLMKYFGLFVAAVVSLSACSSDLEHIEALPQDQAVAPVLHQLAESELTITADNMSSKFVVEWDAANFGEGIIFLTDIYLSYNDVEAALITGLDTKTTSYEINYSQIHTIVSKSVKDGGLGVEANTATDVKMRLGSKVGTTGPVLYSDYATIKVTYTE